MLKFVLNILCDVIHDVLIKFIWLRHRSRKTVDFLRTHVPTFIEPENWPPNSLDLDPVDYSIMGFFTAACLLTAGSRHWAREGRSGNKLGTNQPGLYRSSNRTFAETKGGHVEHFFDYPYDYCRRVKLALRMSVMLRYNEWKWNVPLFCAPPCMYVLVVH